jgi:hypothetical protein
MQWEGMITDLDVAHEIVERAETIIFPSEIMLELLSNLDRIDCMGDIHLPYPYLIIQFTNPIPEETFMAHVEINDWQTIAGMDKDYVEALFLANPSQDPEWKDAADIKRNCLAWFTSTSLNRVSWHAGNKNQRADLSYAPGAKGSLGSNQLENKERLIKIAYLINLFLNAPNVTFQRTHHDPVMQAKRERKGKKKLPDYHTVVIEKIQYTSSPSKGTGTPHSRMYPVRGHFRRIKGYDDPIWIPNHYRGLAHATDSMVKEVYKVKNPKK